MFHNTFFLTPGEILGNPKEEDNANENFKPGIVVSTGWSAVQYLKKFLLSGSVYAATAVTSAGSAEGTKGDPSAEGGEGGEGAQGAEGGSSKSDSGGCDPCTGKLLRRTDLPLYDDSHPPDIKKCDDKPSSLEKNVSAVRKELWVWHDKYKGYHEKIVEVIETGKAHTSALIDQLRQDELPIPRAGAIAISGVAGVVLGLRGGWIKRIVYGSTCAGLMAAICYPQEAAEISQEALATTKKYVQITYNFIYGVKPDSFKLPSPSQLLSGAIEIADRGKGETKTSTPAVSDDIPESPMSFEPPTKKPRQNDQSNPVDKDLYSNRG